MEKQVPVEVYFALETVCSGLESFISDPNAPRDVLKTAEETLENTLKFIPEELSNGEVFLAAIKFLQNYNAQNS